MAAWVRGEPVDAIRATKNPFGVIMIIIPIIIDCLIIAALVLYIGEMFAWWIN